MNGVCPRNIKKPVRYISVALLCHRYLRDSFSLCFLRFSVCLFYVVGLLYHSLFRKNLKWTQVPRSSLLREAIAEGRLSVAMWKLWEAGSRPRVCRAGDVLSRLLSVGKASRQVSSPMAIRNGHGKSCGGDGKKNLMRPLRKSFPIRKPRLITNEMRPLRKSFPIRKPRLITNELRPLRKSFPIRKLRLTTNEMRPLRKFFPSGNHG